jgi:hypothetical protein
LKVLDEEIKEKREEIKTLEDAQDDEFIKRLDKEIKKKRGAADDEYERGIENADYRNSNTD